MTISPHLFDHTATVYRSTESESATLRVKEKTWAAVAGQGEVSIALQARRETWDDPGGGQKVVGEYAGYGPPELDVKEGDVIDVTEGSEAPVTLEVDSVYRPRSHHTQLVLIAWNGSLT